MSSEKRKEVTAPPLAAADSAAADGGSGQRRRKRPKRRGNKKGDTEREQLVVTADTVSENWRKLQCIINVAPPTSSEHPRPGMDRRRGNAAHPRVGRSTSRPTHDRKKNRGVKLPAAVHEKRAVAAAARSASRASAKEAAVGGETAAEAEAPLSRKGELLRPSTGDFKLTKRVAMDCEMVGVGPEGKDSELARVCIVNAFGNVVYDKYVQPRSEVIDYRTKYSGIRAEDLVGAPNFEIVQREVAEILKDRIVIGHALSNDFQALLLSHPFLMTRDTAKYRPLQKRKGKPQALRKLAKSVFNVDIQAGEHSPAEDARTALLLYKQHKQEWERQFERKRMRSTYGKGKRRKPAPAVDADGVDVGGDGEEATEEKVLPDWLKPLNE